MEDYSEEFTGMLLGIFGPRQGHSMRDEVNGFTVSTVNSPDQGWETAILDGNGAHPVQRYADESSAAIGHAKWKQLISSGETQVVELGYGRLFAD